MVNRWGLRVKMGVLMGLILMISGVGAAQTAGFTVPLIESVGVGLVTVKPDRVIVPVRIEARESSAAEAQARTEVTIEAIRAGLEELVPGEFEVVELGLTLTSSALQGNLISRNIEIVLHDDAHVGAVHDLAKESGATNVFNVRYQSTKLEEAAQEARRLAVLNARAKADAITEAMGMRILGVRSAADANRVQMFNPSDPLLDGPMTQRPSDGSTVQRGEIVVQVEVTIQYEIGYTQN